jgi:hypothetical protein
MAALPGRMCPSTAGKRSREQALSQVHDPHMLSCGMRSKVETQDTAGAYSSNNEEILSNAASIQEKILFDTASGENVNV